MKARHRMWTLARVARANSRSFLTLVTCLMLLSLSVPLFRNSKCRMMIPTDRSPDTTYLTIDTSVDRPLRRLGNQLFAYASLLGVAMETKSVPLLPASLPLFRIFRAHRVTRIPDHCSSHTRCTYASCVAIDKQQKAYEYATDLAAVINKTAISNRNIKLLGYFLSWRYFRRIDDLLRNDFRFVDNVLWQAKAKLANITGTFIKTVAYRLIGIHIRRGDFIRYSSYGYLTAERQYFRNAMKYFQDRYAHVLFVVCTEDMTWAKRQLSGNHVVFAENNSAPVDLAILSLCDDVIMSTGTFGWWAGWLAGGDVVYLKRWARPGSKLDKERGQRDDFMPPNWIGME